MALNLPDPRYFTFLHWSSVVYNDNMGVLVTTDRTNWQDWGQRLRQLDANIPDPKGYADWLDWALRARQVSNG